MSEVQDASDYVEHGRRIDANQALANLEAKYGNQGDTAAPKQQLLTPPLDAQGNNVSTVQMIPAAGAGAAALDIAQGVTELPRAAINGTVNAAREIAQSALDVGAAYARAKTGSQVATPKLPNLQPMDDPSSTTGKLAQGVAQFTAGFAATGKALSGWNAGGTAEQVIKRMVQGGLTDMTTFDPHQQNLSNLIQQFPELANPVTDFMSAKPDDTEAEARLKKGLEGLGLGALIEPLAAAVKTLKMAPRVQAQIDQVRPSLPEGSLEATLGDPSQPLAKMSVKGFAAKTARTVAGIKPFQGGDKAAAARGASELSAPAPDPETFINFSRIDTPDDVKNVMQRLADTYKKSIDTARRGVQTFEQIQLNAEQLNAWKVLQDRRTGEGLNAEQAVAARNLWAASGRKLAETAQAAADEPTPANLFAFQKMLAIHRSVQEQVIAARTETARALASWRIPTSGSGARRLTEVKAMLDAAGGEHNAQELAARIASLAQNNMPLELESFVEKSAFAKTREAFQEAWINALLSGPKTHMVNAVSNTSVIVQSLYERALAARIARVLGDEGSVQLGEAMAQWQGMVASLPDAFRYAGKSFRTGESGFGLGKVEFGRQKAISAAAFGIRETGWWGRTVDVLGNAANVPVRALGAVDEFFKTVGYRGEVQAQALRQATREANAGSITPDQFKARIAELAADPPDSIHLDAIDAASYRTFTQASGKVASAVQQLREIIPGAKYILPFVRTPGNIMAYSFERTPLAPLMKHVREDLAAGGARRDITTARIAGGTAIMLWAGDLAMKGQITGRGPVNPAERTALQRSGWQPYSVKVGDRYFAYNRFDPLGTTLGLAADVVETMANDDYGEEKQISQERALIGVAMAAGNNVLNKTYLKGLSDFMEALTQGQSMGEAYFQGLAGTLVPTGVANITQYQDPYAHAASDMIDAIRARTPGLSEGVPYRIDLWGRKISYKSGISDIYDAVSPIYSRRENPEPIDSEILRLEASVSGASKSTSFNGVKVNLELFPKAYQRYLELAGNELKDPAFNLGAKDFLNGVVTGKSPLATVYQHLSDGPDGTKAQFIQTTVNRYRELARQQVLREYPEIASQVEAARQKKQAATIEALQQ